MTQAVGQSWLVIKLGGHGVELGLLAAAISAPVLLGGAAGGALVDRVDRRLVLLVTQSAFLAIGGVLAVLTITGTITMWMLYATALAAGIVTTVDAPARQVYVIDLVGRSNLASAIGLYEVVLNAARVLGPAVGGALLATAGVASCFLFNAIAFVPAVIVLVFHRRTPGVAYVRPAQKVSIRSGIRYSWGHPSIRSCLILAATAGMLFNLGVTAPLLATKVFHLGGGGYGAMNAAFGVGALFGAFAAATGVRTPSGRQVRLLAVLTGAGVLLTAAAPNPVTLFAGLAVAGFLSIWFVAVANTVAQMRSAPEMRGRVMGVWNMALPGMNPLTGLASGSVADAFGARSGFGLSGVVFFCTAAMTWRALAESGTPHDEVTQVYQPE
jgi:MFS family permease